MTNLVLSVDGRQAVHDRLRPAAPEVSPERGSYNRVMANIKKLTEHRIADWYARGTFTRYNMDFSEDVRHLLACGIRNLSLEPVVAPDSAPYALREDDLSAVCAEYERLAQHHLAARQAGEGYTFFHFMVDFGGGPCLQKRLLGCGAGVEYAAVAPDGALYPCHQFVGMPAWRMGHVDEDITRLDIVSAMRKNTVRHKDECQNCFAKYYCSGGCAAAAVTMNGALDKPYHMACVMQRKRVECALALYAHEQLEAVHA